MGPTSNKPTKPRHQASASSSPMDNDDQAGQQQQSDDLAAETQGGGGGGGRLGSADNPLLTSLGSLTSAESSGGGSLSRRSVQQQERRRVGQPAGPPAQRTSGGASGGGRAHLVEPRGQTGRRRRGSMESGPSPSGGAVSKEAPQAAPSVLELAQPLRRRSRNAQRAGGGGTESLAGVAADPSGIATQQQGCHKHAEQHCSQNKTTAAGVMQPSAVKLTARAARGIPLATAPPPPPPSRITTFRGSSSVAASKVVKQALSPPVPLFQYSTTAGASLKGTPISSSSNQQTTKAAQPSSLAEATAAAAAIAATRRLSSSPHPQSSADSPQQQPPLASGASIASYPFDKSTNNNNNQLGASKHQSFEHSSCNNKQQNQQDLKSQKTKTTTNQHAINKNITTEAAGHTQPKTRQANRQREQQSHHHHRINSSVTNINNNNSNCSPLPWQQNINSHPKTTLQQQNYSTSSQNHNSNSNFNLKPNINNNNNTKMADQAVIDKLEAGFAKLQAATPEQCHSLLKKYLTREVLDKLKTKKTAMGATLLDVAQSGFENLDSGVGIYAPDAESYTLFADLFNPIIEDYHGGFKATDKHPASDFGDLDSLVNVDPNNEYVISTRVRCGRSLKGYPFNPCLTEAQYKEMEDKVSSTFKQMEGDLAGTYYPLTGMTKETQQQLIDDHFLFKEGDRFLQTANACRYWPTGRGIYHNEAKTFLVWVNEEDHLRIISMQKGGDLKTIFSRLVKGARSIEAKVPFSRDERLGFLTFCPTNLGTTIRASVHIKLPKLAADRKKLEEVAGRFNLQVRGTSGEHTESVGGVYDISNKRRLGLTEYQAVREMQDGILELIKIEKSL